MLCGTATARTTSSGVTSPLDVRTDCNAAAILCGGLPDWIDPSDLGGFDGTGQAGDPHPNEAGQIAIAEEVAKTVKEETND